MEEMRDEDSDTEALVEQNPQWHYFHSLEPLTYNKQPAHAWYPFESKEVALGFIYAHAPIAPLSETQISMVLDFAGNLVTDVHIPGIETTVKPL